jgi:hypothetical protein
VYIAESGNQRVRRLVPDAAIGPDPAPVVAALTVVNALSLQTGPVTPGEIVSIFGTGLGPESGVPGAIDSSGLLSNLVAGVEVRFDHVPAPLFYVQNQQINVQAPYTIAGSANTRGGLGPQEERRRHRSTGGCGHPALLPVITNQDGSPNSDTPPAPPGSVLTLYATGEGLNEGANIVRKTGGGTFGAARSGGHRDRCRHACRRAVCGERTWPGRGHADQRADARRLSDAGAHRNRADRGGGDGFGVVEVGFATRGLFTP